MKKLIIALALVTFGYSNAQVAIGKTTIDGSGILDFPAGTTNGILLPIVETLPASPANGTILMDKTDLKIKMRQNNAWVNMTDAGSVAGVTFNTTADTGNGVIIGTNTSAATGVLVLEANDKALVLPQVTNPHLTVKSPYPGMMCYDTTSNSVAVFDGLQWSYWK